MTGSFEVVEQRIGRFVQRRFENGAEPIQWIQLLFPAGFYNGEYTLSEQFPSVRPHTIAAFSPQHIASQ